MRTSALRVKGIRLRARLRDLALLSAVSVGFALVGVQLIRNPEEFKYVQWIGEGGNAAIGWVIAVLFAAAWAGIVWGTLRDAGVVPILYAWRSADRVRVGGIVRVLAGRMITVRKGEYVEVAEGPAHDAVPAARGAPRGNPWRISAPAGRIRFTTTYEPGPDHLRQVADWLRQFGIDARAEGTGKQ